MADLRWDYALSLRGALKIARLITAFVAFLCFVISRSQEAYFVLAIMDFIITLLFFLLYFLKFDRKMKFVFCPLVDVFNSLIAALFFFIVSLFAIITKSNVGTLVGGVFGILSFFLCVADSVFLFKKITFNQPRGRNVTN
ncbi:PREDICTED: chemokine-like factor [Gavialis gangeticus]|uniref:chemokine-like factor n=1 Tax=Gavialis gangeticus TaxID=94835 RepID=UPI00092F3652|nr:PREDICTED: chemokine-like factor [Gavialis gangeticus]